VNRLLNCWVLIALSCLPLACARGGYAGRPIGQEYYTQHSIRYERGAYQTTNYQRGALLPINSPVTFVASNSRRLKLTLENGQELLVNNMSRHTGQTMEQGFDRLLGAEPVDLSRFTADEQAAIVDGKIEHTMSREAVLAAVGHPPITGTSSLEQHTWKYWSNKFATFQVVFDDQWRVIECPE